MDLTMPQCGNRCGRRLVSMRRWVEAGRERRKEWTAQGIAGRAGRGLCGPCYTRMYRTGELIDHETTNRPRGYVLEEWERMERDGITFRDAVRFLAPRLDMKPETLRKALLRAGVRSDYNPAA